MSFKPIDPKRDEFRRYLERNGVIESLTKVFVRIVKERPDNPLDYLRHNLGDALQEADTLTYLQTELNETNAELIRLRGIIQNINPKVLEEFDKEKLAQQQKQQQTLNNSNGNDAGEEVIATATVANVVSECANAANVEEASANASNDTKPVENQPEKTVEQAVQDCHIKENTEDEPSKIPQNNANSVEKSIE